MKLTQRQIEEIADELDSGMRCFYNKRTGEILTTMNLNSWIGADEEPCDEINQQIDENWQDLIEFEGMESNDSFRIMEDFAETVDNCVLRSKLLMALSKSKPFQNFKWQIDNSGEYRQMWFDYKKMRYIEWVKDQIELFNSREKQE